MSITINGTGSITGISAGGLPDASITSDDLASNAVTTAKVADANITAAKLSTGAPSWTSGGDLSFNSGYGSVATAYGCRAWVNFDGTGTVAIRASGNVSSITDNGTGDYTVNFTTAMVDADYAVVLGASRDGGAVTIPGNILTAIASSLRFELFTGGGAAVDRQIQTVAIFR